MSNGISSSSSSPSSSSISSSSESSSLVWSLASLVAPLLQLASPTDPPVCPLFNPFVELADDEDDEGEVELGPPAAVLLHVISKHSRLRGNENSVHKWRSSNLTWCKGDFPALTFRPTTLARWQLSHLQIPRTKPAVCWDMSPATNLG